MASSFQSWSPERCAVDMRGGTVLACLLLHCSFCLGFVGQLPRTWLHRPASRPSLSSSPESEIDAATLKIEDWLRQAAQYIPLPGGTSDTRSSSSSSKPQAGLRPVRLNFRASHRQELTFPDHAKALRYLSLPVSNYSFLNTSRITKIGGGDPGLFKLSLPLGEFSSAMAMFSYGSSQSAPALDEHLLAETDFSITSLPHQGSLRLSSSQVNWTFSRAGRTDGGGSRSLPLWLVWADADLPLLSPRNNTLPTASPWQWLVEEDRAASPTGVQAAFQPRLRIWLDWETDEARRRSLLAALKNAIGMKNTLDDKLVVSARVEVGLEVYFRTSLAAASALAVSPVRVAAERAGSLLLSLWVKMAATKLARMLHRDYEKRVL